MRLESTRMIADNRVHTYFCTNLCIRVGHKIHLITHTSSHLQFCYQFCYLYLSSSPVDPKSRASLGIRSRCSISCCKLRPTTWALLRAYPPLRTMKIGVFVSFATRTTSSSRAATASAENPNPPLRGSPAKMSEPALYAIKSGENSRIPSLRAYIQYQTNYGKRGEKTKKKLSIMGKQRTLEHSEHNEITAKRKSLICRS